MKKMFVMAAMTTMMFVGCVKNEPASIPVVSGEQELAFESPVVAPNVKSVTEIAGTIPTDKDSKFAVWASYASNGTYSTYDGKNTYMDNVEVTYNSTDQVWKPEQKYYWPKNGSLTFAAYYPVSENGIYVFGATGLKITDYEVGEVDLLYSDRSYDNKVTKKDGKVQPVTLGFQHALSSIVFTVSLSEANDNVTLTLKKISIKDVNSKGDFDQGIAESTSLKISNPTWTPNTLKTFVAYDESDGQVITKEKKYLRGTHATSNEHDRKVNTSDLFMIPQDIPIGAKLIVEYNVDNGTTEYPESVSADISGNGESWEPGKRYTYNIKVALDEITFDTNVKEWVGSTPEADPEV